MVLPLRAEIVRRSACRGSKSVEARTISSPTFQPLASSTWIDVAPALAVADSLLQVLVVEPCRFRVPPMSTMPRSTGAAATPMPPMSSPLMLLVRVMVALRVWGFAAVPMANSPWSMIHSVVSSRSALLEKLSLPSMERPPRAGGLMSSTTCLSLPMTTLSPAAGTFLFGQVAGTDQFVALTDCALTSWVARTAMAQTTRRAGTSDIGRNERFFSLLMTSTPRKRCLSPDRNAGLSIRRAKLILANAFGGGRDDQFHPDGIRTLEIRSLGRLAQGV